MPQKKRNVGGRIAANFRKANIAEGIAMQMFRPFAAIAPVPRDEDHGIDLIGTLLREDSMTLVAEDSFVVQIKTHTAAHFEFQGKGIEWLRRLQLPYFPVVMNLDTATVSLYTLNSFHMPIHTSLLDHYVFCVEGDNIDDFPLGDPLMQWSIADCTHPQFRIWAYSVLKPAVLIESGNQRFGAMSRFVELIGDTYRFEERHESGQAVDPPRPGKILQAGPGNRQVILDTLRHSIGPFANLVANTVWNDDKSEDLLQLRGCLRRLGLDPDPTNDWNILADDMHAHAAKRKDGM
jgi:hypothetical protein